MMTGIENTQAQRDRLRRGRAEFARIVTERTEQDAIKRGRVYRDFADALQPMPQHAPFAKPHYRGKDYGAVIEMKDAPIVDTRKWKTLGRKIATVFGK